MRRASSIRASSPRRPAPSGEAQAVLEAIARTAARLCEANDALIFRVDGDRLRWIAKHGRLRAAGEVWDFPLDRGSVVGRAVVDRRVVQSRDLARATKTASPEARAAQRATGVRTIVAAPLLQNVRALGAIVIRRTTVRPFTAKQIALLKTFADQAAIAIENAELSAALQERNVALSEALGQQTATSEILRVISGSPTSVQPVFDTILANALRLCEANNGSIFTFDGERFHLAAAAGLSQDFVAHLREMPIVPGSETPLRRVGLDHRVSHVADIFADPSFAPPEAYRRESMRTLLAVPMLQAGRLIGALTFHRHVVRPFTGEQIALLETFADQAVIAIENVRLFTELQARNRDLTAALEQQTATAEILRAISTSPTDAEPVFAAVTASAARLCDAADATIFQVDDGALRVLAHTGPIAAHPVGQGPPLVRGTPPGRAVLDGHTIHVVDVQADSDEYPEGHEHAQRFGHRTVLVVPLLQGGRPIGAIAVRRTVVRPFSDRQIQLLRTFADQAVIAIENVRLFTELDARNRGLTEALSRQTATGEILRVINSSPTDVDPVFKIILANANRLCDASFSVLWLWDGEALTAVAHENVSPPFADLLRTARPGAHRRNPLGVTVMDRTVVHVPDVETDPRFDPDEVPTYRLERARSILSVPMLREGTLVGVINAWRREPRPFTRAQIELLETFAAQAVIAIDNVRLFHELQARNRDLSDALERQTATSEILRVISGSPTDVQPVFEVILDSALRLCEAERGIVFTYDGDTFVGVATRGLSAEAEVEFLTRRVRPGPHSGIGRMLADQRVVQIADVTDDIAYREGDPLRTRTVNLLGARTAAWLPLLKRDTVVGALVIYRCEVRPFTDQQLALVQTFADQAVIAIENVRLFNELQARNRELTEALEQQTATAEILRVISNSPTDVQPVFEAIAESAVRLCNGLFGSVYRFDGQLIHMVAQHNYPAVAIEASARLFPTRPGRHLFSARAILERRVVNVPDVLEDADYSAHELMRAAGFRSVLSVPMLQGGTPIGAITVWHAEVAPFAARHTALLQTFADQAVIAIENVRLFNELESRNRELTTALDRQTATAELLRVISQAQTDVQPVFEAVAESAMRLLAAWGVLVFRYDGELIHLAAARGGLPGTTEVMIQSFQPRPPTSTAMLVDRTISTRTVQHIVDVETEPSWTPGLRENARMRGWRSNLQVPMLSGDEVLGVIGVSRAKPGGFSPAEIALLRTFADQAVIAVKNARLLEQLQARTAQLSRSVDELTALGEVSRALSSTLDLEAVLNTIVSRAVQLSGLDGGVVFEYDEAAEEFIHRAATEAGGTLAEVRRSSRIRKGEGVVGWTAVTLEPAQVPDITAPNAYDSRLRGNLIASGIRALLAVPMVREDRLMGCLVVSRNRVGEFPAETIELLRTFATQSAIAIQNARLFREIADKSRELEVASRHKSQFLANMSHELRTPLNAILGYTELIADGIYGEVPERMREVLERVDKSGRHLLGLINDILDLSKIEAGQLTLTLGPYSMDGIAQTVATQVGALAAEKQLAFEVVVADDLPIGHGDERRLTQVLLNLVGNAIKFTDVGKVVVRVDASGESYVVSVADTGPGIAEADREKIFEEFQQADTTRAKAKGGTGLGLAISRRIVEMHGGRLWVESRLGEGSTFSFMVPVHVERQVTSARAGAAP
jgi:GAF domain-containing protein